MERSGAKEDDCSKSQFKEACIQTEEHFTTDARIVDKKSCPFDPVGPFWIFLSTEGLGIYESP
jgi:hypothetical protein